MDESSDSENDDDNHNLANYKDNNDSNSKSNMFPPLPEVNYKGSSQPTSSTNESQKNN